MTLMRAATFLMRAGSPTEVPPYFWTMRDMGRGKEKSRAESRESRAGAGQECPGRPAGPLLSTLDSGLQASCSVREIADAEQQGLAQHALEPREGGERGPDGPLVALVGREDEGRGVGRLGRG